MRDVRRLRKLTASRGEELSLIRVAIIGVLAMSPVWLASAITTPRAQSEAQQIETLVHKWDEALVDRDHAFIEQILAADFTYVGSSGQLQTRSELLAQLRDEGLKIEHTQSDEIQVRKNREARNRRNDPPRRVLHFETPNDIRGGAHSTHR
jgi:hypothetical protein